MLPVFAAPFKLVYHPFPTFVNIAEAIYPDFCHTFVLIFLFMDVLTGIWMLGII